MAEDPDDVNTALRGARESLGGTEFDRRRVQLIAKFFACGRAVIERLPFQLSVAADTRKKIGPGYWLYVESGGSSLVTFTPKKERDNHGEHYNFPLPTGEIFPGEFEEGIIRIPTGVPAGIMTLWVARFPVPLPQVQEIVGSPIVTPIERPIVMSAPTFATVGAVSGVVIAANPLRRFLSLENTDSTKVVSLAFEGAAAVGGSGVILQPLSGKSWNGPGEDLSKGEVRGISPAGNANVAIQEGI